MEVGNSKTEELRRSVLRQFQNMKDLTPDERKELLFKLSPRGLRPKPPTIKYVEGANIKDLPPKIKAIFERAKQDPDFLNAIIKVLQESTNKLTTHANEQQSFCDKFVYDPNTADKLLKVFGISEGEIKSEIATLGFYQGHRNYSEPFYITLVIVYGIGVYIDNQTLRILSLVLISARYWNANVKKIFPAGCNHDYAKYALQYMTRNNSPYKKYGTPIAFFMKYFIIQNDNFLPLYLRQNMADPKNGLIKILNTVQPKIHGYFTGTFRKHYYDAYDKGLKITSEDAYKSAYANKNEMIEAKETIQNTIDQILDKFKKNKMLAKNVLLKPEVKEFFKKKFNVSDKIIQQINDYISENQEDTDMIAEFLLQGFKPKNEDDFCLIDINTFMKQVGNAKKNEYFLKFKEYRSQITEHIFADIKPKISDNTWYKILNIVGNALFIYFKSLVCKKI